MPETPTIRSLSSREASKDARAALNMSALFVSDLPNGRFVIADRSQTFYMILDEPPTREQFLAYKTLFATTRMSAESKFYGEPSDRELAISLRSERQGSFPKRSTPVLDLDIKL